MRIGLICIGWIALCGVSAAQPQYLISPVAGGALRFPPVLANAAGIAPGAVATDGAGNTYFTSQDAVYKLDQSGIVSLVAGNSKPGFLGDGGPAREAEFAELDGFGPEALAADGAENLYIADEFNGRVRRVSAKGIITTVAGSATQAYASRLGWAIPTLISATAVALDGKGDLFIADRYRSMVYKVAPSGIMSAVAGTGIAGYSGDGGAAVNAQLSGPAGVAADEAGNVYVVDTGNYRIRQIWPDGHISTIGGTGATQFTGDGVPAASASITPSGGITLDAAGNVYFTESSSWRVRSISQAGSLSTFAGVGTCCFTGDGGPAAGARLSLTAASGIAFDGHGSMLIGDTGNLRLRQVSVSGIINTVGGSGKCCESGDGGAAPGAELESPLGVAVDKQGNLFIADYANRRVRRVGADGTITTVAGTGGDITATGTLPNSGPALEIPLAPQQLALDAAGNLFMTDRNGRVLRMTPGGAISTVAFSQASGIAIDGAGTIYLADPANHAVEKVNADGTLTVLAGMGGPASVAQLNSPAGVAVDGAGNLLIADSGNNRVWRLSADGSMKAIAGGANYIIDPADGGCCTLAIGDGGPAVNAYLSGPTSVAADSQGNIFISDGQGLIRKVDASGIITSVAGNRNCCAFRQATQAGVAASIGFPEQLALDGNGNIYFGDNLNQTVWRLQPTAQTVIIGAVADAGSEIAGAVSPGEIVTIYGVGMGPAQLVANSPVAGVFGTQLSGTQVSFNGVAAPILYTSATQIAAVVPYGVAGAGQAMVAVSYAGSTSAAFSVPVTDTVPSFFSSNGTGAGQIAAVNLDGSLNGPLRPVGIRGFISLYATGAGQTKASGVDGKIAAPPYPQPLAGVTVTVGGVNANVVYGGAAPTLVAGMMQVVVQIPDGVAQGGYVPVVMTVGNAGTADGSAWIAVGAGQ